MVRTRTGAVAGGAGWPFLLALLLLVAAVGAFVGVRLHTPEPAPAVTSALTRTVRVPAKAVTLPWPTTGQGAIAVPSIGIDVASGPEKAAPVASLTKLMTAYVVLHDHPLALRQPGPTITITQAELDDYESDTVNDEANAQVLLGEQISEEDVLGGMLVHSANNYADHLARWDAGSIPAFVAKMNADAARLGMHNSHFVDPSGVNPGSTVDGLGPAQGGRPRHGRSRLRLHGRACRPSRCPSPGPSRRTRRCSACRGSSA